MNNLILLSIILCLLLIYLFSYKKDRFITSCSTNSPSCLDTKTYDYIIWKDVDPKNSLRIGAPSTNTILGRQYFQSDDNVIPLFTVYGKINDVLNQPLITYSLSKDNDVTIGGIKYPFTVYAYIRNDDAWPQRNLYEATKSEYFSLQWISTGDYVINGNNYDFSVLLIDSHNKLLLDTNKDVSAGSLVHYGMQGIDKIYIKTKIINNNKYTIQCSSQNCASKSNKTILSPETSVVSIDEHTRPRGSLQPVSFSNAIPLVSIYKKSTNSQVLPIITFSLISNGNYYHIYKFKSSIYQLSEDSDKASVIWHANPNNIINSQFDLILLGKGGRGIVTNKDISNISEYIPGGITQIYVAAQDIIQKTII